MKASKKIILITICAFIFLLQQDVLAQNLTGTWEGVFNTDMDFSGKRRTFFLRMNLVQLGKKIEGEFSNSPMDFPNNPQVTYTISSRLGKKDKIPTRMMVGKIIKDNLLNGQAEVFWQFDDIRHHKNDTLEILYGKWLPNGAKTPRSDGAGGTFWVKKIADAYSAIKKSEESFTTYQERQKIIVDSIVCNNANIDIELYDNATVDGDSVSLYLNDNIILQNTILKDTAIKFQLQLEKNKLYSLTLFAENLGTIPPNTALLKISSGSIKKEIFLSSNYQKNATVVLYMLKNSIISSHLSK